MGFFCELSKFLGEVLEGVAVKLNRKATTKSLHKNPLWFYENTEALACLTTKEEREANSRNRGHAAGTYLQRFDQCFQTQLQQQAPRL